MKTVDGRAMRQCWILMLCATGISCVIVQPPSLNINPLVHNRVRPGGIVRFACPVGFFRLKRNCYYLSGGTAPWREAYFHCKDRNSTLATLDKKGKDRILKKYLMGEQFTKLERWIGGIYNWQQMAWEWGVSGEKIGYQNFDKLDTKDPEQYAWHCVVMDPSVEYKWEPRSCVERKHFICEVPAGGMGRRRRKRIDSSPEPQNQRLKPRKKGPKKTARGKKNRGNRIRSSWRRAWDESRDGQWGNGLKIGSRPPNGETRKNNTLPVPKMSGKFLYFAYGSNLLTKRIHINNPSAVRKNIGKLKNYRLDFNMYSKRWRGAVATIVPTNNSHVWGVVWEMDNSNLPNLDRQEGVADKIYFPLNVQVVTPQGDTLQCRVYQQCKNPEEFVAPGDLPQNRRPSPIYLKTILNGATESGLPEDYMEFLDSIPHNGYTGNTDIGVQLANGVKRGNRTRHRSSRLDNGLGSVRRSSRITQLKPQADDYSPHAVPALSGSPAFHDDSEAIQQFRAKLNDLSLEEILLKP